MLSDVETEIEMRRDASLDDCLRWLAFSAGEVVGFASVFFRKPGTADAAEHGLQIAPVKWEIEVYDEWYRTLDRVDDAHHLIVLPAPDGSVAGLTEATCDSRTPGEIHQGLTAVARSWRARGLTKALKGALLRQVHESHPETRIARTGNGETNAAMRSINARAGFKPHRRFVEYQITREKLDHWRE
ncbi:hypothetical protein JDN40_01225 [Rhodomicrobium vannielii ATCC 17100]|uniref:hypothetical protein n=1 Tax=Rhodomicrobium vannielii TaxID=1069 RepID=UPI001918DA21|nr:hypothetical protein [Rhodomicrobium vannielii]MBJ7532744.1 hypothetical protein [Rhodomicrobium vannielii ATCC 17100]